MKTLIFNNKEQLENDLSELIIESLTNTVLENNSASILLSGGSTPKNLFGKLATSKMDWEKINIGLVDDRMVPEESEFSNGAMIKELLINPIETSKPTFYPLVVHPEDKTQNSEVIQESVEELKTPDLVILGMGDDGHFASLFPNDEDSKKGLSLECEDEIVYTNAPKFPTDRISFSWKQLRQAKQIIVFVTGETKLNIVENPTERNRLPIDVLLNDKEIEPVLYWAP